MFKVKKLRLGSDIAICASFVYVFISFLLAFESEVARLQLTDCDIIGDYSLASSGFHMYPFHVLTIFYP